MLIPASLLLGGVALPLPLFAQAMVQPLPGTTDADRLADLVRELGRNPRDLPALIDAGDLSAKLGDTTAAAALYKRASQIDPGNARVKAGIARILVNGEHPGEALRYFEQAERSGLGVASYADDRGLAYDLIGEQERAQRDYRLALARPGQDNEDEVRRRYALSLGISGRKDEALQQIDALLRKSDRGAWRARAFILAMNGDASGANRIATTMMPAGMATGLAAFFARLPTLSAADRAFAVHFGEVAPTPERLADARLVPALPALAPDSYARSTPVQVAAQAAVPQRNARDRRRGRDAQPQRIATEADRNAQRASTAVASASTSTAAPSSSIVVPAQVAQAGPATVQGYARPLPPPAAVPASTRSAPVGISSSGSTAQLSPGGSSTVLAATRPTTTPTSVTAQPVAAANLAVAADRTVVPGNPSPAPLAATPVATTSVATSTADANNLVRAQSAGASGTVQVANVAAASSPATYPPAQVVAAAAMPTTPPRAESEDSILARIVANISIPASELGVAPMPGAVPPPGASTTLDEAAVAAERNAAAIQRRREVAEAERPAATTRVRRQAVRSAEAEQPAATPRGRDTAAEPVEAATNPRRQPGGKPARLEDAGSSATRRGARGTGKQVAGSEVGDDAVPATTRRNTRSSRKTVDSESAASETKKPAAKTKAGTKAVADREAAADDKKASRAEPERYWIQVAGGATEGDLNKAWASAKGKSSLLAGRAGYSTPLRATNRVVTGPFKTQAEAQAMVNKLSKQGVSAFTFTSAAGQKMTKLDGK